MWECDFKGLLLSLPPCKMKRSSSEHSNLKNTQQTEGSYKTLTKKPSPNLLPYMGAAGFNEGSDVICSYSCGIFFSLCGDLEAV